MSEPPRRETGSRVSSIGWNIRNTHRLFVQTLHPLIAEHMPNVSHWYYMRVLWEEDGITQLELSKRVGITPATAVPALKSMEKHGLIARAQDSRDRRRINVYLTKLGRSLRQDLQPKALKLNDIAIDGLSPEDVAVFERVLVGINSNLRALLEKNGPVDDDTE
ncbi:MAG: MarR family transcriptional regulator [Rhizobiales bacterium]|nr:MarR family transcriptional regulator [Hyphomicrobiales bacterium]OJY06242.1 MAG: hypothetical protein BGP07_01265 [Rhizobiales bacterium 63-22]